MRTNENRSEARGLCMTCNQIDSCIYLARASSPVWHCEEFDDRLPVEEQDTFIVTARLDPVKDYRRAGTDRAGQPQH